MHVLHPAGLVVLGVLACWAALPALANDTVIGGQGASFGPVEEDRAAMRSEHIRIRLENDVFHVHATYRLANLIDEPLSLRIGFPEYRCEPEWMECRTDTRQQFEQMRTTVRGQPVPAVVEKTGQDSQWAEDYPLLWTFAVDFAPLEEVEVVHTYHVQPSADSMGFLYMSYVVRTGANWGAPITSAIFELELPATTCGLNIEGPDDDAFARGHVALTGQTESPDGEARDAAITRAREQHPMLPHRNAETGRWHIRWDFTDWVPAGDFGIMVTPWQACLRAMECPPSWPAAGDQWEQEVENAAEQWTPEQLRLCRNMAWALTGYAFTSEDLREAFYGAGLSELRWSFPLPHRPDPDWAEGRIGPAVHAYARFIRDAERRQRAAESP